jgi:hypothetical protein
MRTFACLLFIVFSMASCKRDKPILKTQQDRLTKTIFKDTTRIPVLGYRFIIDGDFDGDGKQEKLIEHYVSLIDNKETCKFYENADWNETVDSAVQKDPRSFIVSNNPAIDTFNLSSMGQLLGLSYLKNEGDLDGDGADEISYVMNWADWSSLNHWNIASYKNGKWKIIYSFPMCDWQLPDLPGVVNDFGLFGQQGGIALAENDTINTYLENELRNFTGLVKNLGKGKIEIIYMTDEAEKDTMVVDMKKLYLEKKPIKALLPITRMFYLWVVVSV